MRHSEGRTVEVALKDNSNDLELSISDDGVGIDTAENSLRMGHYGIVGMEERATQIVMFHLDTHPGKGTTVRAVLPRNGKE